MNESEAKEFIAREVGRLMWQRVTGAAAVLGVVNLVAFVGLCYSVGSQADAIATARASKAAEDKAQAILEGPLASLNSMTRSADDQVNRLNQNYFDIIKTVGSSEIQLKALNKDYERLKLECDTLGKAVDSTKSEAIIRLAEAANAFDKLPADQKSHVLDLVQSAKTRLDTLERTLGALEGTVGGVRADVEGVKQVVDGKNQTVICKGLEVRDNNRKIAEITAYGDGKEGSLLLYHTSSPDLARLRLHAKLEGGNIYTYSQHSKDVATVQVGQRLGRDGAVLGGLLTVDGKSVLPGTK